MFHVHTSRNKNKCPPTGWSVGQMVSYFHAPYYVLHNGVIGKYSDYPK